MTDLEKILQELTNLKTSIAEIKQANIFTPKKDYMLFAWLDEWYLTYKEPKLKESSLRQIRNCIVNHIKRNIKDTNLVNLTSVDVQKMLNKVKTSRMKKYTYDTINGAIKQAFKLKYLKENIMLEIEPVIHKRKIGRALTLQEESEFLEIIKGHYLENLFRFYLLSGCRKSEIIVIKWTDIDYDNKSIAIKGTKTLTSNRTIPLFNELSELINKIPKTSEYLFPISTNAIKCAFDRLRAKYKFEKFTIHSLRHTFATRCTEKGISLKVIQKWLGHAKLDTTANIYAHVTADFELQEIKKFNSK